MNQIQQGLSPKSCDVVLCVILVYGKGKKKKNKIGESKEIGKQK